LYQINIEKVMKNKNFGLLGAFAIAVAVFFAGCTDPCKDVNCNNGECVEGACVCDAGYEGVDCGTKVNAKFSGTYSLTENCPTLTPPTASYNVIVSPSSNNASEANFAGLFEEPASTVKAVIKSDGVSFTIASQNIGSTSYGRIESSGTPTISADGKTINLTYIFTNNSTSATSTCTATMIRQ
jgi:hypothetical protein